jgi:hypothetical protein
MFRRYNIRNASSLRKKVQGRSKRAGVKMELNLTLKSRAPREK